nr:GGDEF domain-containing protein [Acholeplasmatales bacterium]
YSQYLYYYGNDPKDSVKYLKSAIDNIVYLENYSHNNLYFSILLSKALYHNMNLDLENGMRTSLEALKALEGSKNINMVVQFNINLSYILSELGFPRQALQLVSKFEQNLTYFDNKLKSHLYTCLIFMSMQNSNAQCALKNIKRLEKMDEYKVGYKKSLVETYYMMYYLLKDDYINATLYFNKIKDVYENIKKTVSGHGAFNRSTIFISIARYFAKTGDLKKSIKFYDYIYDHIEFFTGERIRILDEALTIAIELKDIEKIEKYHNLFKTIGQKASYLRDLTDENGEEILVKSLTSISSYQTVLDSIYIINEFLQRLLKANTYPAIEDEFKALCDKFESGAKAKIIFIKNNKYYVNEFNKLIPVLDIGFNQFNNVLYTKLPTIMSVFYKGYNYIMPVKINNEVKAYVLFNNKLKNSVDGSTRALAYEATRTLANAIIQVERYNKLDEKSLTDPLTNLYNRYALKELLEDYEFDKPLYLIEFDLDDFKKINDTYGHPAGDYVLQELSKKFLNIFSRNEIFRFGGEEFLALTHFDREEINNKLNNLETELKNTPFIFENQKIFVTLSYGGVQLNKKQEFILAYENADKLLYKIKNEGKGKGIILEE